MRISSFGAPGALFLSLALVVPVAAQEGGQIRGRVIAPGGAPVAGASVQARSTADTTRVVGALTGQDGAFRIDAPLGDYRLRVSHLGFEAMARDVAIRAGALTADLGTLQMTASAIAIEGVTVEGERSQVVIAADRTIYRTADMPAVQGGVATDALRSVPELDVDLEGRVTLRGASPRIHINGRPTPMTGEALQRFLQQLPSDRIERVEVMPNPSARYEADGAGGIVNIVLKSDASLGLSGSLGLTAGTRGETGAFSNLAYQQGKLTLFGNGSLNFHERGSTQYDLRQNLLVDPTTFLLQEGTAANKGRFSRFDMSAEYQLTGRSTLWSSASGGGFGSDSEGRTSFMNLDQFRDPMDRYFRTMASTWGRNNMDGSLGLKHVIEEGKHEFSVEGRHSRHWGGNDGSFITQLADLDGTLHAADPLLLINDTDEDERRTWLKADYDRPVRGTRMQVGYQANIQTTSNEQFRETLSGGNPISSFRNAFQYDETFHQAYVTASRTVGKLALQAGVRVCGWSRRTPTSSSPPRMSRSRTATPASSPMPTSRTTWAAGGGWGSTTLAGCSARGSGT